MNITTPQPDIAAVAERVAAGRERILGEIRKVIVGQDTVIDEVLMALFTGGHCLITGVPGLAKTLLIKTVAQILDLSFKRIQFTPDLMPADITGTEVLDEAGRTPVAALRQGADLRADHPGRRDQPHPAEDAGGAARGDAGVPRHRRGTDLRARAAVLRARDAEPDRARRHLSAAGSPARSLHVQHRDDLSARGRGSAGRDPDHRRARSTRRRACSAARDILDIQQLVRQVVVSDDVARYAVRLVDASRPGRQSDHQFVREWVKWGAGLRASQSLILAGKARALLNGRYHVSVPDIQALAGPCSGTGSSRTSMRSRSASLPTRSSSGCSKPCPRREAECSDARPIDPP